MGAALVLSCGWAAHPGGKGGTGLSVVPGKEKQLAQTRGLQGPGKTQGIERVATLVELPLGAEFPGLDGLQMRARELVLAPGAVVAVHQHAQRPGFAYMLAGEMVEVRNDTEGALVRRTGDVAVERTGVSHYWENKSGRVARALVVDIVPLGQ